LTENTPLSLSIGLIALLASGAAWIGAFRQRNTNNEKTLAESEARTAAAIKQITEANDKRFDGMERKIDRMASEFGDMREEVGRLKGWNDQSARRTDK